MLFDEKLNRKMLLWLVILTPVLYLLPLGIRPLATPDETRYAEIPREMLAQGDWIVPHLGGLRYFEKPVMGYWLGAVSQKLFGTNNFAVRFSSALATMLAATLLGMVIWRYKQMQTAILTTAIFLSCSLVYFVGTFSVLDAPVSLFVTGALLTFYLGDRAASRLRAMSWLAVMGGCCGLAFLTKGFIALAIPVLVIGPYLVWEKRWKQLLWMPWLPLLTAVITALPWSLAIHRGDSDFWHYFVVVEHLKRFLAADSARHPAPFWYFIPVIIGGMMPWTLLLPGFVTKIKRQWPQDSLTRYCWCWLIFPFLFFSISSGKLGTYILPCFPAVAFLTARGIELYFEQNDYRIFDRTVKIVAIIIWAATGLLIVSQMTALLHFTSGLASKISHGKLTALALYGPGENWKWLTAVGILSVWGYSMIKARRLGCFSEKILWFGLGPLLVYLASSFLCPQLVLQNKAPGPFLSQVAGQIGNGDIVIADNRLFAAACWYWHRSDLLVYRKGGELQYGLNKPAAKGRLITEDAVTNLINDPERKQRVVLLLGDRHWPKSLPLPALSMVDAGGKTCLAVFNR